MKYSNTKYDHTIHVWKDYLQLHCTKLSCAYNASCHAYMISFLLAVRHMLLFCCSIEWWSRGCPQEGVVRSRMTAQHGRVLEKQGGFHYSCRALQMSFCVIIFSLIALVPWWYNRFWWRLHLSHLISNANGSQIGQYRHTIHEFTTSWKLIWGSRHV